MGIFRHTPDDVIFINNTSVPLSFFITLYPTYMLPAGAITRYYEQTKSYTVSNGSDVTILGIPYVDGDSYITDETSIAAAWYDHENPAPTLSQAKEAKIIEMMTYATLIRDGHIIYAANEYRSDEEFLLNRLSEFISGIIAGVPVGYYINDINYVQIAATILDLQAIFLRIVELKYLTYLNADVHRTVINALATIPAVQAYDYSAGWPTIPY